MILYIVRHGETEENLQHILQGHMPGTLTEKGKSQIRAAAEELARRHDTNENHATGQTAFTRIVTSDLLRAADSAQIIAERLHLPVIPMKILRERDWGKWTGMSIAEATDKFRIDGRWQFPEGTTETDEGIYQRAAKALAELKALYDGESIIVVTHGQFARNLVAAHLSCNYHEVIPFTNAEIRAINV